MDVEMVAMGNTGDITMLAAKSRFHAMRMTGRKINSNQWRAFRPATAAPRQKADG
jgi:hypothetical protein